MGVDPGDPRGLEPSARESLEKAIAKWQVSLDGTSGPDPVERGTTPRAELDLDHRPPPVVDWDAESPAPLDDDAVRTGIWIRMLLALVLGVAAHHRAAVGHPRLIDS